MPPRWLLAVLMVLGGLLSACTTPVYCPLIVQLATLKVSAKQVEAPGTLTLTLDVPATSVRCGPGYRALGARFYRDGVLLGEGELVQRHPNGDPARYRYLWEVTPGEDGVSSSGNAQVTLSAALVTDQGVFDETSGYVTERVMVMVGDGPPIETDRQSYTPEAFDDHLRYTIEVSYTNTTGASVYLVPCSVTPPPPLFRLEHFDAGRWRSNYHPVCRTGPGPIPATEVKPNEGFTTDVTLDVYTFRTPENYGYPLLGTDIMAGVNRLVFDIVASVDEQGVANDDPLPLEQRVSNTFFLEAP